ncbi:unnamed protein product [Zymoseptoria tritici ST99CH_1E4]|uniref:HECT-type E3 ubiquitin transferase n=1 Tax=Zymoseptoria tritici ST99CH_1E4 TaxID=1276532 RepID=A0A2H1FN19_ZYMTR|nr:unnamed protein product [Zymoseptoria tritici ST99CH_1E4]
MKKPPSSPPQNSPSQRITRSATARLIADDDENSNIASSAAATTAASSTPAPRKRKAAAEPSPQAARDQRKTKRSKATDTNRIPTPAASLSKTVMSSAGSDFPPSDPLGRADQDRPSEGSSAETSPPQAPRESSRRKSSRRKSKESGPAHAKISRAQGGADLATDTAGAGSGASSTRKPRKSSRKDQDVLMKDAGEKTEELADEETDGGAARQDTGGRPDGSDEPPRGFPHDELDALDRGEDPFASGYLARFGGHAGLSSSLRALSGIVSGTNGRLRNILEQLRTKEEPSVQLIALQDLSELLLVSNEDNLAGHFAPDQFVKELVTLMQPNDFTGEENPEIMLLACRCIANLMEALPAATASVVYGGAVPVLCQKLLEIHFIDLAEQALSTLEKISLEFPSSIVREGGLTACLTYLDFFATSTQRTAVTTAANCCRNIPEDSFPTVRDVMPILLTTLSSSDQRVVEQASVCVSRVIDSFKYHESKLEELVSPELLKAILRLLLPGSTNMIGPSVHTSFLRVLSITARASPRLSVELFKMNVVDTLYQILTGVSPPAGTDGVAAKIDKNVIMQSIIRTPREQIFETLNVICELLPTVSQERLMFLDDLQDAGFVGSKNVTMATRAKASPNDKRIELLKDCPQQVKRFAIILFPTLMHAYTSTVNLSVRQKVLTAQLKMLSNLDTEILQEALRGVTYASHLASILSQQENATLVTFALQAAELLLKRMESVYRPQFYREGVMAEIVKLSDRSMKVNGSQTEQAKSAANQPPVEHALEQHINVDVDVDVDEADIEEDDNPEDDEHPENDDEDEEGQDDEDDEDDEDERPNALDRSDDSDLISPHTAQQIVDPQDTITLRAQRFLQAHKDGGSEDMRTRATDALDEIKTLATQLTACYGPSSTKDGTVLLRQLAKYFGGDALESITSYELMTSGIVDVLLNIFTVEDDEVASRARSEFLEVFMANSDHANIATGDSNSPATAFSVLVHKLQDVLSRAEHFEVITVHHNAFESSRGSAASMLAKQLRLKLAADEDSGVPRSYRNIMVSIHAIATFKALEDYLRPRISLSERPRGVRRDGISSAMAAYAAAMAGRDRGDGSGALTRPPTKPTSTKTSGKKSPKAKTSTADVASPAGSKKPQDPSSQLRRSSRRQSAQTPSAANPELPDAGNEANSRDHADLQTLPGPQEPVECPDEERMLDEDDDDMDADLEALVDDLEEGGLEDDGPDPSAVSLEVAKSGKITARTEDGASVGTPSQGTQTPTGRDGVSAFARLAAARELLSTPTATNRAMSYASALQQPPQDWHIEFSVNGQPIASDTTIYRACHFNQTPTGEISGRTIWSATHTITFKRVDGPASADRSPPLVPTTDTAQSNTLPPSLSEHPVTAGILRLMSILHDLNANLDDVLAENKTSIKLNPEPASQFVNTKLTAKLNRQMDEPLIVASQCLPSWSEDLARLYPFLFPFETRHLFLQSTSFGYSRLMARWQSSQPESDGRHGRHRDERPFLGRVQRQKVRISRSRILESAIKVMELYGSSSSVLEVEYFEEVGTGLGPTLEFYATVSKEFSKKKIKLWRENESSDGSTYAFGKRGLFPAPMSEAMSRDENGTRVLHLFKMLGKFIARSMLDSRIIDVSFNPTFFRIGDGSATVTPSLGAVATVDEGLAKSLKMLRKYASAKQRIEEDDRLTAVQQAAKIEQVRVNDARLEDLGLDFTLPGYPEIELQPHGSTTNVTMDNVGVYVKKVIEFTLGTGVQRQIDAFRAGFSQVFPYSALKAFTPEELVMLFGRVEEDWSLETLTDAIKADHGYNLDSLSVRNLLQMMSELPAPAKRDFLQFVTGSPKLPIGGFKSLTPLFTVVCKPSEPPYTSDDYLPSVNTCAHYLKMPNYSSVEVLRARFKIAMEEGQGAFHLS